MLIETLDLSVLDRNKNGAKSLEQRSKKTDRRRKKRKKKDKSRFF